MNYYHVFYINEQGQELFVPVEARSKLGARIKAKAKIGEKAQILRIRHKQQKNDNNSKLRV